MTQDEALDLALKTLRSVAGELYRVTSYCDTYDALAETNNAIMDIQQARSAPVQKRPQNCGTGYCSCVECVMEPAPVQEPVAWRWTNGKGWLTYGEMPHDRFESTPLYTTPTAAQQAPVQEPVALGKPTDEMVQAATDEYDEWAFDNKGTTECIRAMLVKALKVQPAAQPAPVKPVAQAWDEGYRAGIDDERTSEASIGIAGFDAKVEPARNNPYCTTPPAQPAPVREDWGPGPHEYHSLPAPVQEPPDNKYNAKRIAWELERTAMGDGYYGNALYVAMDMPQTTKNDREMLHRYMCGSNLKTDHVKLQDLAMRIYTTPPAQPAVPLTDEEIDAKFDAFASKFDHESNEWLDMGADAYFRAGFRVAHGITVTPEKGGTP